MELITDFHTILDQLIALNLERRKLLINEKKFDFEYVSQYCTVKCDIGRASGKTEYIKSRATINDAIIIARPGGGYTPKMDTVSFIATLFVARDINTYNIHLINNRSYNKIYIDEPNNVFKYINIYEIYKYFTKKDIEQTFIFLG